MMRWASNHAPFSIGTGLAAGLAIPGPAIIEERECTIFVGPDATANVHESGMLIITLEGAQ